MLLWAVSHQLDAVRFISLCSQFVQFSSVLKSCWSLCNAMDCSMPGFLIHHQLLELTQAHVHRLGDAIQPSHPVFTYSSCFQTFLISGSFPISQLFLSGGQIIGAQLQHQFFQWIFRRDFFFRMDWFDLLAVQGTLKSLLQQHSSKGIYVYHLSVTSYSPFWNLTTRKECKQCSKMSVKTQCPIYTHLVTRRGSCCIQGTAIDRSQAGIGPRSPGWVIKQDCLYLAATVVLSSLIGKTFHNNIFCMFGLADKIFHSIYPMRKLYQK